MYLDTLELLEYFSGKDQYDLLSSCHWDHDLAKVFDAAYNFNRKYFIKQLPELSPSAPYIGGHLPDLLSLLERLETRALTGDAARNAVKVLLDGCTSLERKWFSRVILKDLRCGIGLSTIRKAGFNVPEFEVQLAKDGKDCKNVAKIIAKGVWVSRKYDGYRCLAIVANGEATLYTRNGKEYENFPSIQAALVKACGTAGVGVRVFDGEIMSDDFQSMQKSAFASKRGTTVGDVKYHIFDMVATDEWQTQKFAELASQRFANLDKFFESIKDQSLPLVKVEHQFTTSHDKVLELERQWISEGFEGAMVLPDIPYYLGRKSNAMLKFKTMLSMDCTVVGVYEGTGKYAGSLGGIRVTQAQGAQCDVGSGFVDREREEIYAAPDSVVGRIAEIKYQNLSEDGVMRFPVFVRWRDKGDGSGKI